MNKNIFLLWQGQLVSQLGHQAFVIAMMYYLMEATGSATLMGVILTLSSLPAVLAGPFSGVLVDSLSRKAIIVVTDIIRGLSVLSLALVMYLQPENHSLIISGFAVVVVIAGLMRTFFNTAVASATPDLTDKDKLDKTNALFQSTVQFAQVVGQPIGAVLYKLLGAPMLLLIDGISYLLSAFSEALIKMPKHATDRQVSVKSAIKRFKQNFKEGLAYVKGVKGMLVTMLFICSINFFIAPVVLLLPFYAEQQILGGVQWYGFLLSSMAVGTICGAVLVAKMALSDLKRPRFLLRAMYLAGSSVALLGLTDIKLVALLAMFLLGCSIGMFNVPSITLFQKSPPPEMRGRVFSLLQSIVSAAMPLGFLLSGLVGDLTGQNLLLIFCCVGALIILSTLWIAGRSDVRAYMSGSIN